MYSWEIQNTMEKYNYTLPSDAYIQICQESNQIAGVKYSPYGDYHEIWTNDNCYWKFKVTIN